MHTESTVFALSTPVGGAIAVMRISGPDAKAVLSAVFTGKIEHRRASFGLIRDENGETVDTASAVFYEAPHSYTGEDMAEISFHGSYAAAARLTELIEKLAVPAEPGEFTKRAYLNGKLDLAEAEAVMDLISASAEQSRRAAVLQLTGRLSAVVSGLYERMRLACARLANYLDDDTGEIYLDTEELSLELKGISADINALREDGLRSRILREGARVALIGSPNVGKSSLLNALLMRERAIVTAIPGTTRDTLEESMSFGGIPVVLIDTAGIRETSDEIEKMGVDRSKQAAENADLELILIEGSRALNADDEALLASAVNRNALAVITKSDLEQAVFPDDNGLFRGLPCVLTSSLTGAGLNELRQRAASLLLPDGECAGTPLVTNSRHVALLEKAAERVAAAVSAIDSGLSDIQYHELRLAMDDLAAILGVQDPGEELINSIFANFCIGK